MKFKQSYHESQKNWHKETFSAKAKGQLISEWLFGVLNFPKQKQCKNLMNFCPRISKVVKPDNQRPFLMLIMLNNP